MHNLNLRLAGVQDAAPILAMTVALSVEEGEAPPTITEKTLIRDLLGPKAHATIWIAEQDGQPIGFAMAYPGYDLATGTRGMHLGDLYVTPEARGKGIGRALVEQVGLASRALGGTWVSWTWLESNKNAEQFYRRLGASLRPDIRHGALALSSVA